MSEAQTSKGQAFKDLHLGRRHLRDAERMERRQRLHAAGSGVPRRRHQQRGHRILSGPPRLRGRAHPAGRAGGDRADCWRASDTRQHGCGERLRTYAGRGGRDHPPGGRDRRGGGQHRRLCRRLRHRRSLRSGAIGGEDRGCGERRRVPAVSVHADREGRVLPHGASEPVRGIGDTGSTCIGKRARTASTSPASRTPRPSAGW